MFLRGGGVCIAASQSTMNLQVGTSYVRNFIPQEGYEGTKKRCLWTGPGRNQKNIFRGERGPSPPNFCNDLTEKGAGVLSPPNIWSRDRQQSRIGAHWRTPA